MYPGIGNESLEAPLPLVLSFPSWLGFTEGLYIPEAGQENSRGIRRTDATPRLPLPRAAFDHPAAPAPAARFSLSLWAAPWPAASPPQPGILRVTQDSLRRNQSGASGAEGQSHRAKSHQKSECRHLGPDLVPLGLLTAEWAGCGHWVPGWGRQSEVRES